MYDRSTTSTFPSRTTSPEEDAWEKLLLEIVDAVSIPASEYQRIERHYKAISEILIDPVNVELADGYVFPQGSFLTRTVVRALGEGERRHSHRRGSGFETRRLHHFPLSRPSSRRAARRVNV